MLCGALFMPKPKLILELLECLARSLSCTKIPAMAALLPKPLLHIEGGCVAIVSCILYQQVHGHWNLFLVLLLVPDLSMLGYLINKRLGAVCYNFVHTYSVPLLLFIVSRLLHNQSWDWLLLIWIAHIGLDRAIGYGLKYPTGFRDTHLRKV
jgi:Domain of unknown function (DUF4260)